MSLPAYLRVLSILDVLLSVEEPVGNLVLAWVANDGHHTLNLNTLSSIQFYYVASLSGYFQQFFFQKISINREFLPKVKSSLNENTKLITFDRCMKQMIQMLVFGANRPSGPKLVQCHRTLGQA